LPIFVLSCASYWLLVTTESRTSFLAIIIALPIVLLLLRKRVWIIPVILLCFLGLLFSPNLTKRFTLTFTYSIEFIQKKMDNRQTLLPIALAQVGQPPIVPQGFVPQATKSASEPVTAKTEKPVPGEPAGLLERIVFRSGGIRFNVEWPRATQAFLKNPIFGTGYSSITLATDNDYLRALGETGILGLLAFLTIFLELGRRITAFFKRKSQSWPRTIVAGMTGVIIAMAVNALFIDVFEASKIAIIFWLLIGILVATIRISQNENV
jgi:O-antigen ligase